MHRSRIAALLAVLGVVAVLPALAAAAPPVFREHVHFTSEPYAENLCEIPGTAVDEVVASFTLYESGATLERLNVLTVFTATASGKSVEIRSTGARRVTAPLDNGDGTYSIIARNTGPSPIFKLPNGPTIVLDVGLVEFRITFDSGTDEFLSFDVVRVEGPRPAGCATLEAALT
jgi:hypothetical protein